jgi:high-affinity Fe2+/Pb2+ permease
MGAAFLWKPGYGSLMVTGPFASILLGGAEGALIGAVGGSLLGALIGWGVSKKHILKYEEKLKGGKYLVIAYGDTDEVERAHSILDSTEPDEIGLHQD